MQWSVEERTPYVHCRQYVAVVVPVHPRIGTFHLLALPTGESQDFRPVDESWGQVPYPYNDPLLHIFEVVFEFDNKARFKFRSKEVSQRYTGHLSKLAKRFRGGYRMTFESMSKWR